MSQRWSMGRRPQYLFGCGKNPQTWQSLRIVDVLANSIQESEFY